MDKISILTIVVVIFSKQIVTITDEESGKNLTESPFSSELPIPSNIQQQNKTKQHK